MCVDKRNECIQFALGSAQHVDVRVAAATAEYASLAVDAASEPHAHALFDDEGSVDRFDAQSSRVDGGVKSGGAVVGVDAGGDIFNALTRKSVKLPFCSGRGHKTCDS